MGSYVVLRIGRSTLVDHDAPMSPGGAGRWFVLRTGKDFALLFADAPAETAEHMVERFGAEILRVHREKRGILVTDVGEDPTDEPIADSYDDLVRELSRRGGRWVAHLSHDPHTNVPQKNEIPVPDLPRSKVLDFHVVPPTRAMREHALSETPRRVVRRNLSAKAEPKAVVAFYLPKMEAAGFTVEHDSWPKKKTEELDGLRKDARLVIGTVATSPGEVFVQLLFITR